MLLSEEMQTLAKRCVRDIARELSSQVEDFAQQLALAAALDPSTELPKRVEQLAGWWRAIALREAGRALILQPDWNELARTKAASVLSGHDWLIERAIADAERHFLSSWPHGRYRSADQLRGLWANRVTLDAKTLYRRREAERNTLSLDQGRELSIDTKVGKELELDELKYSLEAALNCLSPLQRAVLRLSYLREASPAQVAETLEISDATLRSTKSQALKRLRALLADREEELTGQSP